jgi:hypothetical protein
VETAIEKLNNNLVPIVGYGVPSNSAAYIGQLYVNTAIPQLYYAKSTGTGASDWVTV